jgi:hypothetical protein
MRGEEQGPTWPNQSRQGSNLAILGLKLAERERAWAHLSITCAELVPLGSNPTVVQHGTFGRKSGLTWARQAQCGERHEPPVRAMGQVGLKLGPHRPKALPATWSRLVAASHQVGAQCRDDTGNIAELSFVDESMPKNVENTSENAVSSSCGNVPRAERTWLNLGRSCSQTGPAWSQVAPCSTRQRQVGAKWVQVEPMLRTCRVETVNLDDVAPL